jgi:hypothetical protein
MLARAVSGPSWLGIGAQRSGTTWLAGLLLQHPELNLSRLGRKELHFFDRFLLDEFTDRDRAAYRELFDRPCAGEFTPGYMRWLWVPPLAREACGEDVTLLVLLRDPVERFGSAMRWSLLRRSKRPRGRTGGQWIKDKGSDAIWGGMYASQLRVWARTFSPEQIVVEQYERAIGDPRASVMRIWSRLGLPPAEVSLSERDLRLSPTTTSPEPGFDALRGHLRGLYEVEVRTLADEWGIDSSLWPNFA